MDGWMGFAALCLPYIDDGVGFQKFHHSVWRGGANWHCESEIGFNTALKQQKKQMTCVL
jgi:hypothetical protein